jgi:hypothetical protein
MRMCGVGAGGGGWEIVEQGRYCTKVLRTPRSAVKGQMTASLVEKESEGTY